MEVVDPQVGNSLFEILNGLFVENGGFEDTLENMVLPASTEAEVGDERNYSENCRKSSSYFCDLCSQTYVSDLIHSHFVLIISYSEQSWTIPFFKFGFLSVKILEVSKFSKSNGVYEVF